MSPFEAEKEGFVRVTAHSKQRPARWTLRKYIKNFEAADEYLEVMEGESEQLLDNLKNGDFFEDKPLLKSKFKEKLEEGLTEKALFDDLDKLRYYYDTVSEKVSDFVLHVDDLTCLSEDIVSEYKKFKAELIDKKEAFFEPLEEEIKHSLGGFEELISELVAKTSDKAVVEEFFKVAETEGVFLTEETVSDELVNFIIATSNSVREVRKTKLQEAKKHFKKLLKS